MIAHGGALDKAIAEFGGARSDWIDLSTGINPTSYPLPQMSQEVWQRLPDRNLEQAALDAARAYYGIKPEAGLVAAPGTQALIQLYPHLAPPGNAVVIGPTYEEHTHALGMAGRDVRYERSLAAVDADDMIVVVVNPNNPDGRVLPVDALLFMADQLAERGGLLVVDEAFADTDPAVSVAGHAGADGLLVLKSFGKFFGLAGVRLGFAAGAPEVTEVLASMLGPWAVSGPALAIAAKAYADAPTIERMRGELAQMRKGLEAVLTDAGLQVLGRTDLFVLARHFQAAHIHKSLCERHILARKFDYQADWLRFGFPKNEADLERVRNALSQIMAAL
ncbi:MAG: threonine-phosphate decarboxylase CobD [Rhizobiaceae bacterium]